MQALEVRSLASYISSFEELSVNTRMVPSVIMIAIASKMVIIKSSLKMSFHRFNFKGVFFLFNILAFVGVLICGWKLSSKNEHHPLLPRNGFENSAKENPGFTYESVASLQNQRTDEAQTSRQ